MVKRKTITLLMFLFLFGFIGLGYMHEQVHVAIYNLNGIEAHAEYFKEWPDLKTIPERNCDTEGCILAHNINEVVGYPLQIIYMVVCLATLIILTDKEER